MTSISVVVEHNGAEILASTWHTITAASQLGKSVNALLLSTQSQSQALANILSTCSSVDKVAVATHDCFEHILPETAAPAITTMVNSLNSSHCLFPSSTFGKDIMPRASALANSQAISDISKVVSESEFERFLYAGNCHATVATTNENSPTFITVRSTSFDRAQYDPNPSENCSIEDLSDKVTADPSFSNHVNNPRSQWIEDQYVVTERPSLTSASKVVSGGRGMKGSENFKMLYDLADILGGNVGASRAAVDSEFASNDMQIGQTGKTVAPDLYIAAGISGAMQHLAGMKTSKTIVVVNNDPDAPFFEVADYGLVDDLFKAIPELTEKLKARG